MGVSLPHQSPTLVREFALAAAMGEFPGCITMDKYGEGPSVTAGAASDIWDLGGTYTYDAIGNV